MRVERLVAGEDISDEEVPVKTEVVKKTPHRQLVYCPVPEHTAPPLRKVSQHLWQYHELGDAEVYRLLRGGRSPVRRARGM